MGNSGLAITATREWRVPYGADMTKPAPTTRKPQRSPTDIRFCSEISLARLQLAELLLERHPGEKSKVLEHMDLASKSSTSWMPSWSL